MDRYRWRVFGRCDCRDGPREQPLAHCDGSFGSFGHFTHGFAANDPSIGVKTVVNFFIVPTQDIGRDAGCGRCKAAGMKAAVDGRAHVADDEGSHKQTLALPRQGLSLYGIPDGAPIED